MEVVDLPNSIGGLGVSQLGARVLLRTVLACDQIRVRWSFRRLLRRRFLPALWRENLDAVALELILRRSHVCTADVTIVQRTGHIALHTLLGLACLQVV